MQVIFLQNVIFDDPYRHKTQQMSCTSSSRVCVQNFAIVQRGVQEEIGLRQNKQTLKYLVEIVN